MEKSIIEKIILKVFLSRFETSYKWLKIHKCFSETEEQNIENAIKSIKIDNQIVI